MWKYKRLIKDLVIKWQFRRLGHQIVSNYGPPMIVIGMHRSGTSLVTRLLRGVGGYVGSVLEPNSEAVVFIRFNDCILGCLNASWFMVSDDYDSNALKNNSTVWLKVLSNQKMLWSEFFKDFGADGVENNYQRGEYLGPDKSILELMLTHKWHLPQCGRLLWGWKDPRNTFTLPTWLMLFPNARILHVIRNGIDAALSLWRRARKSGEGAPRCLDLSYCFKLWERYVSEGLKWRSLAPSQYHEVRYEDLLYDPSKYLERLLSFMGMPTDNIKSLVKVVDTTKLSNNSRWLEHIKLLDQAHKSTIFRKLGYDRYTSIVYSKRYSAGNPLI